MSRLDWNSIILSTIACATILGATALLRGCAEAEAEAQAKRTTTIYHYDCEDAPERGEK
jgi:hypothetical protein